ncbi:MAG: hypothetical protein JXR10_12060 [Cyclobacteriaceae bacterium]
MFGLFSKKKKFKASCDLSGSPLEKESTYLVSTAQIISSKKFWDNKMTEPDTMTYTEAYFKNADQNATNIRGMIFNKYAAEDKIWVISDSQINLFDIDEKESKAYADQWWESEGTEVPSELQASLSDLGESTFESHKTYAIQEAGRKMVSL